VSRRPYPVDVEYADIQGGILTAYGKQGFPWGRFGLICVRDAAAGRAFIENLRHDVTTAVRWPSSKQAIPEGRLMIERPAVTLNLAFTYCGLKALGVPTRTLRGLPDEFMDSMAGRANILGDDAPNNPMSEWDEVWNPKKRGADVHILVMLNGTITLDGKPPPELRAMQDRIASYCDGTKVELLAGHRGPDPHWQELEAIKDEKGVPCPKEHFGFTDGISDPVFEGQYPKQYEKDRAVGSGATDGEGNWRPLAAGEFLLGWPDEAQEIPGAAMPLDFSRNGTFMAYRKLNQEVAGFKAWVDEAAAQLQQVWNLPSFEVAHATLMAKMAGRWEDGVPLDVAPDWDAWKKFNAECEPDEEGHVVRDDSARARALVDFGYRTDADGFRCPMGAHIRRCNTRDMLDPRGDSPDPKSRMGSALNNRRRILRRGLPYGKENDAEGECGIIMLVVCASLQRQFEFVQQQWLNYGLDANSGNDTCPLLGNHDDESKFVIPADPRTGNPPFIATRLKQFVTTRGGDYFFIPSMTALRMLGMGVIDPT
jgi:Dyp-type peroxidase family